MATESAFSSRTLLEHEYMAWANICERKHGLPWPITKEALASVSDQEIQMAIQHLRALARTPPE